MGEAELDGMGLGEFEREDSGAMGVVSAGRLRGAGWATR